MDRASATAGDSRDVARLAVGPAGSPGNGEGPGPAGGDAGARVLLRTAASRRPMGRGDLTTGTAPVGGSRVPVTAGAAAPGDITAQTCPAPGCGLSVLAAEYPPAVPPAHCAGGGGALSRDLRDPARTGGPPLHGGRPQCLRGPLLAEGRAARDRALGARGGHRPPYEGT